MRTNLGYEYNYNFYLSNQKSHKPKSPAIDRDKNDQLTDIFNDGDGHRFGDLHVLADGYCRRVMMLDVSLVQPVTDPTAPVRAIIGQPVPDQFHPVPRSIVATRYPVQ